MSCFNDHLFIEEVESVLYSKEVRDKIREKVITKYNTLSTKDKCTIDWTGDGQSIGQIGISMEYRDRALEEYIHAKAFQEIGRKFYFLDDENEVLYDIGKNEAELLQVNDERKLVRIDKTLYDLLSKKGIRTAEPMVIELEDTECN